MKSDKLDIADKHSIYLPLKTYEKLKWLSKAKGMKQCDVIAKALYIMEEIESDKTTQFKLLKDLIKDWVMAFEELATNIRCLQEKDSEMSKAFCQLVKELREFE